jgi:hypothetical protein
MESQGQDFLSGFLSSSKAAFIPSLTTASQRTPTGDSGDTCFNYYLFIEAESHYIA